MKEVNQRSDDMRKQQMEILVGRVRKNDQRGVEGLVIYNLIGPESRSWRKEEIDVSKESPRVGPRIKIHGSYVTTEVDG